ncbi:MAG TPA: hypothetical protein V6D19_09420 [Stenomitos sp.]
MTDNISSPPLPTAGEIPVADHQNALNAGAREAVVFKMQHGIPNLTYKAAKTGEGTDSDQVIRGLYEAITKGNFPMGSLELKHNLRSYFVPSSF